MRLPCYKLQGNRIKTANKKACDYSICGSTTISFKEIEIHLILCKSGGENIA